MKGTLRLKVKELTVDCAKNCIFNDRETLCTCEAIKESFLGRVCDVSLGNSSKCTHWRVGEKKKERIFAKKVKKYTEVSTRVRKNVKQ